MQSDGIEQGPFRRWNNVLRVLFGVSGAVVTLGASPALAYVRAKTPAGAELKWDVLEVGFRVSSAGSDDIASTAETEALRSAFKAWEDVPCAYLKFRYDGGTDATAPKYEASKPNDNGVFWIESGWTQGSGTIAFTVITYERTSGKILDADITFDGEHYNYSASSAAVRNNMDLQAVATHEVGHLLGLDHSSEPGATMGFPMYPSDLSARDLTDDDAAGACAIYPLGSEPLGPSGGGDEESEGCRNTSKPDVLWLLAAGLLLVRSRRRR